MGYSIVAADRVLLDFKVILLSIMYLETVLKKKQNQIANDLIRYIRMDLDKINKSPHLLGSFETVYKKSISPRDLESIISLLENGNIPAAKIEIKRINAILGDELSARLSETRAYPTSRPIIA